jgi:hypothetical protein
MRRIACLLAVVALAALPAAAGAQSLLGSPQIGNPTPTTSTTPATNPNAAPNGGGLTTAEEIGLFAFGVGLLAVIAVIIVTDARRKAPVAQLEDDEPTMVKHHKQVKQRRRAQGREAKRQRKKNRPRR